MTKGETTMRVVVLILAFLSANAYANTCDKITELGYPKTGSCSADTDNVSNTDAEIQIVSANVCWGSFGSEGDSSNAVAVELNTSDNETIEYIWEMPSGRANRSSVNSYTYFGRWRNGVFFEDQSTFKEEGIFLKSFLSQGVVINYKAKEVHIVKTTKRFFGKQKTVIDALLACGQIVDNP